MMQLKTLEKRESRLETCLRTGFAELMAIYRISEGISAAFSRVTPSDMKNLAQKMSVLTAMVSESSTRSSFKRLKMFRSKCRRSTTAPASLYAALPEAKSWACHDLFGSISASANEDEQKLTRMVAEMGCDYINDHENRRLNSQLDEIGARLEAGFQ
jgi:hypothetical protein